MGVTGMRELVEITTSTLDSYAGDVVAVDAHHWLYRYMTVQVRYLDESEYTRSDGVELPNAVGILRGLPTLFKSDVTPVFVFDGAPNDLKEDEITQRRTNREEAEEKLEAARERGDIESVRKYKSQSQRLTEEIHRTSRDLLELFGVPYVEANGAGEGYAAKLAASDDNPVTAVLSGDYDSVLFGAPEVIRPFSSDDGVEVIDFSQTLSELCISHQELIDAAILMGTDYNEGVYRVGPKRSVSYMQDGRTAVDVITDRDCNHLDEQSVQQVREVFLNPPDGDPVSDVLSGSRDREFHAVEGYLRGTCELPEDVIQKNLIRFPSY